MNTHPQKEHKNNGLHKYLECGLDNVWIRGGFKEIPGPDGERTISIIDLDGLHKCIAQCLTKKGARLTGAEFRFLRTELDLSQSTMGLLCGREERTVRGWETREEPVEEPANTIIRFVYEQRFNAEAKYEEVSRTIRELQALDKELHELKLQNNGQGWKPVPKREARAA